MNVSGDYAFPLSIKNYNDLRANTLTPRLLVILNLPGARHGWLSHTVNDLIIRNCAFWLNLKGAPDVGNTTNITVHLPAINVFSPDSLKNLMVSVKTRNFMSYSNKILDLASKVNFTSLQQYFLARGW
jgi:hypothetical protein